MVENDTRQILDDVVLIAVELAAFVAEHAGHNIKRPASMYPSAALAEKRLIKLGWSYLDSR